jgi:acetyl esterase/lipase
MYRHLLDDGQPATTLFLAGDSAGGGLTLALLQAVRDAGWPMPAGAVLFSPWTDLAMTGDSIETNAERDVLFHVSGLRAAAQLYLADLPADDWRVSPLYGDFTGLPPILIQASDTEMLLDDATRVDEKARHARVDSTFRAWSAVPHAWQIFAFLPEARQALKEAGEFIRRHARKPV